MDVFRLSFFTHDVGRAEVPITISTRCISHFALIVWFSSFIADFFFFSSSTKTPKSFFIIGTLALRLESDASMNDFIIIFHLSIAQTLIAKKPASSRSPISRKIVLWPERDRVRPQRAKRSSACRRSRPSTTRSRPNDLTPVILKLKAANPEHPAPYRGATRTRSCSGARRRAELPGQGGRARRRDQALRQPRASGRPSERANGPFALLGGPAPGLVIEKFRPEGQAVEKAFAKASRPRRGSDVPAGGHQLAGGGLWVLKLALDAAKTDDLDNVPHGGALARPAGRLASTAGE